MKSVFISHSSTDAVYANSIVEMLEREGISAWIAPRDIPAGSNYGASITKGIRECAVLVLVFSRNSNESQAVFREVQKAFEEKKVIIPLRIEDVPVSDDLSFYLSGLHWLDALPKKKNVDELVRDVKQVLQNIGNEIHEADPQSMAAAPGKTQGMLWIIKKIAIVAASVFAGVITILFIIGLIFPEMPAEPAPEEIASPAAELTPEPTSEATPSPSPEATPEPEPEFTLPAWQQVLEYAIELAEVRRENITFLEIAQNENPEHGYVWDVRLFEFSPFGEVHKFFLIGVENGEVYYYNERLDTFPYRLEPPKEGQIGWERALEIALEHTDTDRKEILEMGMIAGRWFFGELEWPEWDMWVVDFTGIFFDREVFQFVIICADTGDILQQGSQ